MSCPGLLYLISISSFALQFGNKQKNKFYFNKGEHKIYLQLHYLLPKGQPFVEGRDHSSREEAIHQKGRPFIKGGGDCSSREGGGCSLREDEFVKRHSSRDRASNASREGGDRASRGRRPCREAGDRVERQETALRGRRPR